MSTRAKKFYMVRLEGGDWEPVVKHPSLAKAMRAAFVTASYRGKVATILQTVCRLTVVDGKPVWEQVTPER